MQNNPAAMAALQKNILEHISFMAQEQIQLEFVDEIQEAQMIQQQMQDAKSYDDATKSTVDARCTTYSTDNFTNRITKS